MLNLYWKIFLGFWFTGLLLGGGVFIVNQQLRHDLPLELQGLTPAEIINRTAFIIRRLPQDIANWKRELEANDIGLYLEQTGQQSLSKTNPPPAITAVFDQLQVTAHVEQSTFTRLIIGKQEQSPTGQTVRFVMDMPSVNLFRLRQFSEQITVQLVLAISLSAIACFILARYLTRHLKELGIANQALAAGDLTARIHPGKRFFKDELSLLAEDFNHMAESLEKSVESQRRLVRDISHELRSPLARLQIALELARNNNNPEQLDRIELEAERLNNLIGQILAMPEGQYVRDDITDIAQLLKEITDANEIEANAKQVRLSLKIKPDSNYELKANLTQLRSALENVIRNAIHYTDVNTVVAIQLKATNKTLQIVVEDNGTGVPNTDLDLIFEPFYRVDPARNRKTGGYGVGLAIVKRAIENHKGTVKAVNTNHGLSVMITLPRAS